MYDSHFSFMPKYLYNRFIGLCLQMLYTAKSIKTVITIIQIVLPSGQNLKTVVISSFATLTPCLCPSNEVSDIPNANTEIPFISCDIYQKVKFFEWNIIEIKNGTSIPQKPIAASPAFPMELPSHNIFGSGKKWNSTTFPPNKTAASKCPNSCKPGYRRSAVNKPTTSSQMDFLTSFILYRLLRLSCKKRLPLFKTAA